MISLLIPAILKEKRLFPVHKKSISSAPVARRYARALRAAAFFRKPVDDQALPDAVRWAISVANRGKIMTNVWRSNLSTRERVALMA
jgi:hypothetical protein